MTTAPKPRFPLPRRVAEALLDVIFPRECPVCGNEPDEPRFRFLSRQGISRLQFIGGTCCPRCGAPSPEITAIQGECVFCRERDFHFGRSRSLVVFDAAARRIVHAIKYRSVHAAAADLAEAAADSEHFSAHLSGATLVPVPLFSKRENKRGYNQSRIFAEALSRRIAGTRCETLLARTRDTGTQTALGSDARRGNVRNAFSVPEKLKARISAETRYVLVDDVFTTGSTLSECARALKKAGAKIVDAATFAHG